MKRVEIQNWTLELMEPRQKTHTAQEDVDRLNEFSGWGGKGVRGWERGKGKLKNPLWLNPRIWLTLGFLRKTPPFKLLRSYVENDNKTLITKTFWTKEISCKMQSNFFLLSSCVLQRRVPIEIESPKDVYIYIYV